MTKINHIGLIPDGNRRWAIKNSMDYLKAYKISMHNLAKFIQFSSEKNIRSISIYMLSKENLKRQREDLNAVLNAESYFIWEILPNVSRRLKYTIIHAGDISILPENLRNGLSYICQESNRYTRNRLYLLIGYNPIDEINNTIVSKKRETISIENLWVPEKVDLVIRTVGGPTLLSNFLPLQCGYAQIYMIDKYFNDFNKRDFSAVYAKACSVNMRYGK